MPLRKGAAKWLDQNARNYLISDGLLFKILDDGEENLDTVLCIPTSKVHILLNAYHSSILGGHTGITKCYHIIMQRFYCPNLAENLRAYITGCHVCQMFKKGKDFKRPYQKRINLNVLVMTKISMDIKQMPVNKGYSHILVLLCEVINYMVALPLVSTRTPHILDAFQRGYLAYFGPPTHLVCDQDPAFTSSLMEAFVTQLNIKVILVSPTNHQSLRAEHGIESLSGLLVKHLSTVWSWHSVLPYSMLCNNGYLSPNLNGYSPYELVFGHKMTKPNDISDPYETTFTARTLNDTVQVRERRGFGSILVQTIPGLITLAIESVSSYIKGRQQERINIMVEALRNDDNKIRNDLRQHRNELLMYGRYNLNSLRGVINTINALHDT